ncbi:selina-4(15),7(11)-diene synthase [Streptomyces sp. NBC_01262]|uniref:selina-4(15),7(11)-diene synthase n=1 Tax=Streptomyces sp. NBC_01262 TaxID=2903803 RepID=UPI002E34DB26|nr:selina-4(15),7(11)-diene synthase [Streptomyces sp. NBC_01262]
MEPDLAVPPIYSPLRSAIHPRHVAIDAHTAAWAETFSIGSPELRSQLVKSDIGTFAARIFPEGREEVITIAGDFMLWIFGVDDGYCEEGELGTRPGELLGALARLIRVAQNPEAPMLVDDPLALGLRDLRYRMDRYGTPVQVTRWVEALGDYFQAVVWESFHRVQGTVPSLNDYTMMRMYDGATPIILPMLEMGYGYELQPNERDHTSVRALAEMAHFIIGWDNDILSHHKEHRAGGYYLNAVRVLAHEYAIGAGQALATAIAYRDRVMVLFLRMAEYLKVTGSPQLRQYIDSLGDFIRGAQEWEVTSVRYTTPDDPANLPSTFRDTPTDDNPEPLDIPAISWWWDLVPDLLDTTVSQGAAYGPSTSLHSFLHPMTQRTA